MQYCFEEVKKQLTNFKRAYATAACRYVRRHAYSCWKNVTPDSDLYQQDIGGGLLRRSLTFPHKNSPGNYPVS